jgi:hypothetical protein
MSQILLHAMAKASASANVPMLLVTLDNPAYEPDIEARLQEEDESFNPICFENDMRMLAHSANIFHLGLQSVFRRSYLTDGKILHGSDGHWNYAGHRLVADALAKKVAEILRIDAERSTAFRTHTDRNVHV